MQLRDNHLRLLAGRKIVLPQQHVHGPDFRLGVRGPISGPLVLPQRGIVCKPPRRRLKDSRDEHLSCRSIAVQHTCVHRPVARGSSRGHIQGCKLKLNTTGDRAASSDQQHALGGACRSRRCENTRQRTRGGISRRIRSCDQRVGRTIVVCRTLQKRQNTMVRYRITSCSPIRRPFDKESSIKGREINRVVPNQHKLRSIV